MTRKLLTLAVLALFVSASPLGYVGTAVAKQKGASHASGKSKGKSSSHAGGSKGGGKSASKGGGGKSGGGSGGGGGKSDNPLDTAKSVMGVLGGMMGK